MIHNIQIMSKLIFLGAFLATLYVIPRIQGVVRFKRLMDDPNERSSHSESTPSLGGIAFYVILMITFYFANVFDEYNEIISFIPGLTILFIAGLKDDLVVLGPLSKLLTQTLAAVFLVFHYKFSIESLHGFMGIDGLPSWMGAPIAVFIILTCINAINLIDGIDGLAATIGIIVFSGFAALFYIAGKEMLFVTCLALTGSLIAFLRYNLSSKKKIFMGDTGSMILGFMTGAMTVRLLALDHSILAKLPFHIENIPYVLIALLFVPLFDTGRVFLIRILHKKSPFSADRNHIHHLIMDNFSLSHRRTSFYIGGANIATIILVTSMAKNTNQYLLLGILSICNLSLMFFFHFLGKRREHFHLPGKNHKQHNIKLIRLIDKILD